MSEKQKKQDNINPTISGGPDKKMRQIIIETDGTHINLAKSEAAGTLELIAILQSLVIFLQNPKR